MDPALHVPTTLSDINKAFRLEEEREKKEAAEASSKQNASFLVNSWLDGVI